MSAHTPSRAPPSVPESGGRATAPPLPLRDEECSGQVHASRDALSPAARARQQPASANGCQRLRERPCAGGTWGAPGCISSVRAAFWRHTTALLMASRRFSPWHSEPRHSQPQPLSGQPCNRLPVAISSCPARPGLALPLQYRMPCTALPCAAYPAAPCRPARRGALRGCLPVGAAASPASRRCLGATPRRPGPTLGMCLHHAPLCPAAPASRRRLCAASRPAAAPASLCCACALPPPLPPPGRAQRGAGAVVRRAPGHQRRRVHCSRHRAGGPRGERGRPGVCVCVRVRVCVCVCV